MKALKGPPFSPRFSKRALGNCLHHYMRPGRRYAKEWRDHHCKSGSEAVVALGGIDREGRQLAARSDGLKQRHHLSKSGAKEIPIVVNSFELKHMITPPVTQKSKNGAVSSFKLLFGHAGDDPVKTLIHHWRLRFQC
jgi:hypothetical protein